jgi:hypothetical protein
VAATRIQQRFSVPLGERDLAMDALKRGGFGVVDADDGGADESNRDGSMRAVLVATSADLVEDVTPDVERAFVEAVHGCVLTSGVNDCRLVGQPSKR